MKDEKSLTHFDYYGAAHLVDISEKKSTNRIAVAKCRVRMLAVTLKLLQDGNLKKGDVLGVARIAGIMAAKNTADIIPLCHPLPLSHVSIKFLIISDLCQIEIESTVKTTGNTGVEMEALTAATVSALTIYDMLKSVDKGIIIEDTRLIMKDGGKSGLYQNKEKI